MRIIGGKLKGKVILPPAGYKARPTTDFAKEGLFNILDNEYEFEDLKVLDLFGGTGSIAHTRRKERLRNCFLKSKHRQSLPCLP